MAKITVNGESTETEIPITMEEFLIKLKIQPELVAVEHNLKILKRAEHSTTNIKENDQIEIIRFVGGGSSV